MSWSSASCTRIRSGACRSDDDLVGQRGQVLAVVRLAARHVVERRVDARAAGVAGEVAAVERVVAVVVQVLHVVRGDRHLLRPVGRLGRVVLRRVGPGVELGPLDLDAVLLERVVDARPPRPRAACRRCAPAASSAALSPAVAFTPMLPSSIALAVAVVEAAGRVVVQRVRVTEDPPGVRVGRGPAAGRPGRPPTARRRPWRRRRPARSPRRCPRGPAVRAPSCRSQKRCASVSSAGGTASVDLDRRCPRPARRRSGGPARRRRAG